MEFGPIAGKSPENVGAQGSDSGDLRFPSLDVGENADVGGTDPQRRMEPGPPKAIMVMSALPSLPATDAFGGGGPCGSESWGGRGVRTRDREPLARGVATRTLRRLGAWLSPGIANLEDAGGEREISWESWAARWLGTTPS